MARKKPAKKANKASARKAAKKKGAPRKAARPMKKAAKKASTSAKPSAGRSKPASRKAPKKVAKKVAKKATRKAVPKARAARSAAKRPNLDRPRKTVADIPGIPSSLNPPGGSSAAKTGYAELRDKLRKHTSTGPALTSGDVDADWESAETVGDEAPGGDNPTPDQDVVDDIGRALGVEYEDDEELQGGSEISERDRKRWELDPASKDDFDED
jgi:hypothetical protein